MAKAEVVLATVYLKFCT